MAAAVTGAVIALALPRALVGVYYDDGIYAALAKSLAEGHGYRLLYLPGQPAAVHYPFLYPAFLAGLWSLWPAFPDNVPLLRGANAALMALFAGLATAYLGERLRPRGWGAPLAVVLATTAVPLVAVATVLFSEPLYLVLVVAACWAGDAAGATDGRRGLGLAVLAGAAAGLSALTRSIGVAVVLGVAVALVAARRPRHAVAALVPAGALLAPWMLWTARHAGGVDPATAANYGTYGDFLAQGGVAWLSPASLVEFARPLAAIALPPLPDWARLLAAVPVLGVLVLGVRALTRAAPAAGWMLVVYLAIVAVWPYGPDRFVWAVLPWLFCAMAAGLAGAFVAQGPRARLWRAAAVLSVLLTAAGFGRLQVRGYARGGATSVQRGISETFNVVLPWIREATDTAAVIAGEDEALLWLYTGRRAVPSFLWRVRGRAAESLGPDTLRAYLERTGATHLVLTGPGSDAAVTINDLLGRAPGYLRLVYVWPGSIMAFQVARAAADSTPRAVR